MLFHCKKLSKLAAKLGISVELVSADRKKIAARFMMKEKMLTASPWRKSIVFPILPRKNAIPRVCISEKMCIFAERKKNKKE